jgi:glycosyltransferase involved in cell wall biosynthesis
MTIKHEEFDISVIIPAYNASDTLDRCLSSLKSQVTSLTFEVLVVDSSPDSSSDKIVSKYSFVKLIRSPIRLYPGAARNVGMQAVRGTFTFFLDAHNFAAPNWLENTYQCLAAGSFDIVGGSRRIDASASLAQMAQYYVEFMDFLPNLVGSDTSFVPAGNSAMRSLEKNERGFPEELRAAEDLVYFLKRHQKGARIGFFPELCVEYVPKKNFFACLRHLQLLGYWSGKARASYRLPGKRGRFFNYILPLAIPYRFAKLTRNVFRIGSLPKSSFLMSLPIVIIYLVTWTLGQMRGAWGPVKTLSPEI